MNKYPTAHVFSEFRHVIGHLNSLRGNIYVVRIAEMERSYLMKDGTEHKCFVVNDSRDTDQFLGWMFHEVVIHRKGRLNWWASLKGLTEILSACVRSTECRVTIID